MVFTHGPTAHLPCLASRAGLGRITRSSGIVRFVQGGVLKTFRWATQSTQMATFNNARELAEHLLRDATQRLTDSAPEVNHYSLWSVGGASALLGFDNYAQSCKSVLQSLPDDNFTAGLISNFPLPKKPAPALRQIAPLERLQSDHPPMTDESLAQYIRDSGNSQEHLRLACDGLYSDAFSACKSELDTEETAAAQAVLGDIDAALASAESVVKPDFRADNVRFICTIELFRAERWDDANKLFNTTYPDQIGADAAAHMALGANHRLPWLGYPFPDW